MAHTLKQLGQSRPSGTSAGSLYSPSSGEETVVHNIIVCNTSTSSAKYSIYIDDDGTTYDQSTALFYEVDLAAKASVAIEVKLCMNNSNGNLAVQTDTASALTFTANGEVFS